jgi:hypothetical protein
MYAALDCAVPSDQEWRKGDPGPLDAATAENDKAVRSMSYAENTDSWRGIDSHRWSLMGGTSLGRDQYITARSGDGLASVCGKAESSGSGVEPHRQIAYWSNANWRGR